MWYVTRDSKNQIINAYRQPQAHADEPLADDNTEVVTFFQNLMFPAIKNEKNNNLKVCENEYITYCRSLNLSDKASMEDFQALATEYEATNKTQDANNMLFKAQFLITNIIQNGGNWDGIEWHSDIISDKVE